MKELSIEEKAKAYDEVFQEVKDLFVGRKKMYNDFNTTLEYLFPKLKEYDDERTKNQLIDFVKLSLAGFSQCEKYIAWINKHCEQDKEYLYDVIVALWDLLDKIDSVSESYIDDTDSDNPFRKIMHITQERHKFVKSDGYNLFIDNVKITNCKSPEKQSEQDTINRIEPKFKVGDWITNDKGHSYLIAAIDSDDNRYLFEIGGYTHEQLNWEYIENADNHYHLWSIKDAKYGDILVSESNSGFIYNGKFNETSVGAYCGLNVINSFIVSKSEAQWASNDNVKPATKEQRDSLIKAMSEAGYIFDFNKRELKTVYRDIQSTKDDRTATAIITGEPLIKK